MYIYDVQYQYLNLIHLIIGTFRFCFASLFSFLLRFLSYKHLNEWEDNKKILVGPLYQKGEL